MNPITKKYLIIGGVALVGYLLWKKSQRNSLPSAKQMECDKRYSELSQPDVEKSPEYWKKKKEEWMKINCK